MGAFYIGPLTIQYQWLVIIIAAFVSYLFLEHFTKRNTSFQKSFIDTVANGVLIGVLIYKFSILIFRPSLLFTNPIAVVYFTGGQKGLILSSIFFITYMVWKTRQLQWEPKVVVKLMVILVFAFYFTYILVKYLFLQIL